MTTAPPWSEAELQVLRDGLRRGNLHREIAQTLGRPTTAVSRRASDLGLTAGRRTCKVCGTSLAGLPGRFRLYCGDACRKAAELQRDLPVRQRYLAVRAAERADLTCRNPDCGAPIHVEPTEPVRMYCNKTCSHRAWYLKSRGRRA